MLETQPTNGQALLRAPMVRGIDPAAEASVSSLASNIVSGELDLSGRGLVIGAKMATTNENPSASARFTVKPTLH